MTQIAQLGQTVNEDDNLASATKSYAVVTRRKNSPPTSSAGSDGDAAHLNTDAYGRLYAVNEPVAADGMTNARNLGATATGQVLVASACTVYQLDIENGDSGTIYIKIYDKATAATSSDTPVRTYVQATLTGRSIPFPQGLKFTNGVSVRAVTTIVDNGNTGATANTIHAAISYKA